MNEQDKKLLAKLSGSVKMIIEHELSCGNEITEVGEGWPLKEVNVWLKKRFHKDYSDLENITYFKTNDAHYWYDEYTDDKNGFFVGTRF